MRTSTLPCCTPARRAMPIDRASVAPSALVKLEASLTCSSSVPSATGSTEVTLVLVLADVVLADVVLADVVVPLVCVCVEAVPDVTVELLAVVV